MFSGKELALHNLDLSNPHAHKREFLALAQHMESIFDLYCKLKLSNFNSVNLLPKDILCLIIRTMLHNQSPNNIFKAILSYPMLDADYAKLLNENIQCLQEFMKDESFWIAQTYFFQQGLPCGFAEIKTILNKPDMSNQKKWQEVKRIAHANLNEKYIFGLFSKQLPTLIESFFRAIVNNTLNNFYVKFSRTYYREKNPKSDVVLRSAEQWG